MVSSQLNSRLGFINPGLTLSQLLGMLHGTRLPSELLLRNAAYRPAQKAQEQERRLVEASTFEQARHGRTDG